MSSSSRAFRFRSKQIVNVVALLVILSLFLISGIQGFRGTFVNINQIEVSPDGKYILVGMSVARPANVAFKAYVADVCQTIALFSVDEHEAPILVDREVRKGNQGPMVETVPQSVFFDGGERVAFLLWRNGTLQVWDMNTRTLSSITNEFTRDISAFAFSSDGETVATICGINLILWNIRTGKEMHVVDNVFPPFWQRKPIAFSPDGTKIFLTVNLDIGERSTELFELETGQRYFKIPVQRNFDVVYAFSPEGSSLAIVDEEKLQIWDLVRKKVQVETTLPYRKNYAPNTIEIAYSPDGRLLAAVGAYGLRLIDARTTKIMAKLENEPWGRPFNCVAFSPDGHLLVTGGMEGNLKIWDVASRKLLRTIPIRETYKIPFTIPLALFGVWLVIANWERMRKTMFFRIF